MRILRIRFRIRIPNTVKYASHPVILLPLNSPPSHYRIRLHTLLSYFPFISTSCHHLPLATLLFPLAKHLILLSLSSPPSHSPHPHTTHRSHFPCISFSCHSILPLSKHLILLPLNSSPSHSAHTLHSLLSPFPFISFSCHSKPFS
jgi:hypothetical protein